MVNVRLAGIWHVVIFSDAINMINVELCMIVVHMDLYPFIPLSMTLIVFQGHSSQIVTMEAVAQTFRLTAPKRMTAFSPVHSMNLWGKMGQTFKVFQKRHWIKFFIAGYFVYLDGCNTCFMTLFLSTCLRFCLLLSFFLSFFRRFWSFLSFFFLSGPKYNRYG